MNWKTLTLTVSALLIVPTSINAAESYQTNLDRGIENMGLYAQRAKRGKSDRGQKMERMLQQLNLTSEQSQQIEAIKERSQTNMEGLREQAKVQKEEMQTLLASDASTEEIREQQQEAQNLRQQLDSNRFETMLEIREILTPEQRARMLELRESHRGRRSNRQKS